jgi:hypothetical protein
VGRKWVKWGQGGPRGEASVPALREGTESLGVARSERCLLLVGPALELLLACNRFGARGERFGVDEFYGVACGGPGCTFTLIVRCDAIGEILAGSCVERAVGAAEKVGVEQRGTPGDASADEGPRRLRAERTWTTVPFDSLRSLRTFDSSPLPPCRRKRRACHERVPAAAPAAAGTSRMEPGGFEPPCRNRRARASTRVVVESISIRGLADDGRRGSRHTKVSLRGGMPARWSQPESRQCTTPSGVRRCTARSIRPRERTACWQTLLCILFTWQGCSTTRHPGPYLPGRCRSAPIERTAEHRRPIPPASGRRRGSIPPNSCRRRGGPVDADPGPGRHPLAMKRLAAAARAAAVAGSVPGNVPGNLPGSG